ncbi:MAG: Ig domain-containing protein [Bryobacteraceae bacterium]
MLKTNRRRAIGLLALTSAAAFAQAPASSALRIITTTCAGGTQYAAYSGCTIAATGGTPPYTFSWSTAPSYGSLPEGMSLDASSGAITSSQIGGQGTYGVQFIVTDAVNSTATQNISFGITGSNAFLKSIFPGNSIFHHRMDFAISGLPVDTSPAAPIYSGYLPETIKPFFGNASAGPPNGIPAFEVPCSQAYVPVTTVPGGYQHYFTSGPIPANAPIEGTSNNSNATNYIGDGHVLIYQEAGCGNVTPGLWEMFTSQLVTGGAWEDDSNALWPDVATNALTTQGKGTADAAGLPIAPLLLNADEVIGTGTPTSPNGVVRHPTRFTLNHMLNNWVWPATETAGVGSCTGVPTGTLLSQSSPPSACGFSGPAGEIYRLKASVANPSCTATSPQAAIIIRGLRHFGIILADNGDSGGLIGTPDTRWNDNDLSCLRNLTLADFEPVNVSSLMIYRDSGKTADARDQPR